MKLETIKKDKKKNIIIGSMIVLSVVAGITLTTTRAKYRSVQSLKLASGTVNYKASDLHIVAIKISDDGINYIDQIDIPESGYTLNTEKSKCRIPTSTLTGENAPADESIPIEYKDGRVYIGVNKKNTKCYLYFNKVLGKKSTAIIAAIEKSAGYKGSATPTFSSVATGSETENNNGIYKVSDGMYGGYSYYWRGAATTNHVIFANKCWRIIRINGDKTVRLIYNGELSNDGSNTCTNATSILNSTAYSASKDRAEYVGWTYNTNSQRTQSGADSNAKHFTEEWFNDNNNFTDEDRAKVVSGKFCNDRTIKNGEWSSQPTTMMYYKAQERIEEGSRTPTLNCSDSKDIYSLQIGAITADEVQFAGASGTTDNKNYYLYTGTYYWTMTPYAWYYFNASNKYCAVYYVGTNGALGYLGASGVQASLNLKPVINLHSDTLYNNDADGTSSNPYIVQ